MPETVKRITLNLNAEELRMLSEIKKLMNQNYHEVYRNILTFYYHHIFHK